VSDAIAYGAIALASCAITLIVIDRFVFEIPILRKLGNKTLWLIGVLAAAALAAGGVFIVLKNRKDPAEKIPPVEPDAFDDSPERKTDADADNTNLSALVTDRDVADLDVAADARDEDLDRLRARLDKL